MGCNRLPNTAHAWVHHRQTPAALHDAVDLALQQQFPAISDRLDTYIMPHVPYQQQLWKQPRNAAGLIEEHTTLQSLVNCLTRV